MLIDNGVRIEFWKSVYLAYVGAANATKKEAAAEWADIALKAFDERFGNEAEKEVK